MRNEMNSGQSAEDRVKRQWQFHYEEEGGR